MEQKDYKKRKPDLETESFKAWNLKDKSEKEKAKNELVEGEGFEIKYKELTIKCLGFNLLRHKETKELGFAHKIKHDEKLILYHFPNPNIKGDIKGLKLGELLTGLKVIAKTIGYEVKSMNEVVKELYNEKHILDKSNDEKKGVSSRGA